LSRERKAWWALFVLALADAVLVLKDSL